MADGNLKHLIDAAGVTAEEFADIVGVDPKTVQRWRAGRIPQRRHRAAIARALDRTQHALWPDESPAPPDAAGDQPGAPAEPVSEVTATWPSPQSPGAPTLPAFLAAAREQIDMLEGGSGLRRSPGLVDQLCEHARDGCEVRMLIDNFTPELSPLIGYPGIEVRAIDLRLVHAVMRADDRMLLGLWLAGDQPIPLLQLHRQTNGGLFDRVVSHFDAVWNVAQPILDAPHDPTPGTATRDTKTSGPPPHSNTDDRALPRRWPRQTS